MTELGQRGWGQYGITANDDEDDDFAVVIGPQPNSARMPKSPNSLPKRLGFYYFLTGGSLLTLSGETLNVDGVDWDFYLKRSFGIE